jgi:DNA-binding response OmpR family regulator
MPKVWNTEGLNFSRTIDTHISSLRKDGLRKMGRSNVTWSSEFSDH